MTLIVENGAGLRAGEAYVSVSYVDAYLTSMGRSTENSWSSATTSQKEDAIRAATQYVDGRWGGRLRGTRAYRFDGRKATAKLTFSGQPSNGDTLLVGDLTYTFVSALTGDVENEVLIGASGDATAESLNDAINGAASALGSTVGSDVLANRSCSATYGSSVVSLEATEVGSNGNDTNLDASSASNVASRAFLFGLDGGPQPLEFPRLGLVTADGHVVYGLPQGLKDAVCEYAVRAHSAALFRDPTVDDRGYAVTEKTEKVGPITETTKFSTGTPSLIRPYPAADALMRPYLRPAGVLRG